MPYSEACSIRHIPSVNGVWYNLAGQCEPIYCCEYWIDTIISQCTKWFIFRISLQKINYRLYVSIFYLHIQTLITVTSCRHQTYTLFVKVYSTWLMTPSGTSKIKNVPTKNEGIMNWNHWWTCYSTVFSIHLQIFCKTITKCRYFNIHNIIHRITSDIHPNTFTAGVYMV